MPEAQPKTAEVKRRPLYENLVNENIAAEALGVSVSKLQKFRVTGDGPAFVKIGRQVRYDLRELQKYVEQNTVRSTSELRERRAPPPANPEGIT